MSELRELLTGMGYGDVRTLVNSGNVVLTSSSKPERLEGALEKAIANELGVDTRVLVRTRDELAGVIKRNPMRAETKEPKRLQVSFLSGKPDPKLVRELSTLDVAPERLAFSGREIYTWHPGGIQRSPVLRAIADERIGVVSTRRNWNTVTKLLEMADE